MNPGPDKQEIDVDALLASAAELLEALRASVELHNAGEHRATIDQSIKIAKALGEIANRAHQRQKARDAATAKLTPAAVVRWAKNLTRDDRAHLVEQMAAIDARGPLE